MADHLIARKIQTSTSNQYIPADCACGYCSVGTPQPECGFTNGVRDWTSNWLTCCGGFCPQQRNCVRPDWNECSIGADSLGEEPLVAVEWDGAAPNLKCTFDASKIDSIEQVDKFRSKFGSDDPIMPAFCVQPVAECPSGLKSCSRIKSIAPGSDQCRKWFYDLKTDEMRDAIAEDYCFRYNTDDCRCVNRAFSEEYKYLKKGNPINDKCWFVPCANAERHFVTSDLIKGSCPENICSVIFDVYKDRDVSIYGNDIVCETGPPGESFFQFLEDNWVAVFALAIIVMVGYVMK